MKIRPTIKLTRIKELRQLLRLNHEQQAALEAARLRYLAEVGELVLGMDEFTSNGKAA